MDLGESLLEAKELGGFIDPSSLDRTEERQVSNFYLLVLGTSITRGGTKWQ